MYTLNSSRSPHCSAGHASWMNVNDYSSYIEKKYSFMTFNIGGMLVCAI